MKVNLIRAKMTEHGMTQESLIHSLSEHGVTISRSALSQRLSGKVEFVRDEISALIEIFNLSPDETQSIFFSR